MVSNVQGNLGECKKGNFPKKVLPTNLDSQVLPGLKKVIIDYRKKYLFDKTIKEFFSTKNKEEFYKNGLRITVRERDYPILLSIKDELSQAIHCTVHVYKKIKSQTYQLLTEKTSPEDKFLARKQYLLNRAVREFFLIEDRSEILEKGLSISVRAKDYPLMLKVQDELRQLIHCNVYIHKRVKSQSRSERKEYLFDKTVKESAAVEGVHEITGYGLSISARARDYPLMLEMQEELIQVLQCNVRIYKRAETEVNIH
jgi:hypothetical protein